MWTEPAQPPLDDGAHTPFGIDAGFGAAVVVAATAAAMLFPPTERTARLVMLAAAVAGHACVGGARASLVTAGLGFLLFTGFLVNRYGELTWDGAASPRELALFVLAAGAGLGWRWIRHARARAVFEVDLDRLLAGDSTSREEGPRA